MLQSRTAQLTGGACRGVLQQAETPVGHFQGLPDYLDLSLDISVTPVGGPNRHSNLRPLSPSHPCVIAAEIRAGEGGATCSSECAGEVLASVNHDVYSLGVPAVFPELTEKLVFMAGH